MKIKLKLAIPQIGGVVPEALSAKLGEPVEMMLSFTA
jgi:hypothetical protein